MAEQIGGCALAIMALMLLAFVLFGTSERNEGCTIRVKIETVAPAASLKDNSSRAEAK